MHYLMTLAAMIDPELGDWELLVRDIVALAVSPRNAR